MDLHEGNPVEGNQGAEELPTDSPHFPRAQLPPGTLSLETAMGTAGIVPTHSGYSGPEAPEPSQVLAVEPNLLLQRQGKEGTMGLGKYGHNFKLPSRTERPYPPTSRCNSISTQHWAKSTGRWSEITLDP